MSTGDEVLATGLLALIEALLAQEYLAHVRDGTESGALAVAAELRESHSCEYITSASFLEMMSEARMRAWRDSEESR